MDITYEEWFDKYKPKTNSNGDVVYLETYGDELDTVVSTPNEFVWTIVDGGDYFGYSAGAHFVNRLNYVICEVPWEDESLYVDLYEPDECEKSGHVYQIVERYDGKHYECCEYCGEDKDYLESIDE